MYPSGLLSYSVLANRVGSSRVAFFRTIFPVPDSKKLIRFLKAFAQAKRTGKAHGSASGVVRSSTIRQMLWFDLPPADPPRVRCGFSDSRRTDETEQYSDEQILAIVKEGEAGRKVADLCRTHGITEQTYYRWKAKYGGMELSEMQRLKQLEDENRRLKHIVAEQTLDIQALKAVVAKKW